MATGSEFSRQSGAQFGGGQELEACFPCFPCFPGAYFCPCRYINALDAGSFAKQFERTVLHTSQQLNQVLTSAHNRTSNRESVVVRLRLESKFQECFLKRPPVISTFVPLGDVSELVCWFAVFIMCGSPTDLLEAKNGTKDADSSDILFLLIDLYKSVVYDCWYSLSLAFPPITTILPHSDQYYTNTSSMPSMQNVLVLTMPNTRNYTINTDVNSASMVRCPPLRYCQQLHQERRSGPQMLLFSVRPQMNDYMAAYHDAVLLIGQVMRKIIQKNPSELQEREFVSVNYFRNTSFNGEKEREAKYSGGKVLVGKMELV